MLFNFISKLSKPNFLIGTTPRYFIARYKPITKEDREKPNVATGQELADILKDRIKRYMDNKFEQDPSLPRPGAAFFLVGERKDSVLYINKKRDLCKDLGFYYQEYRLPGNVDEQSLMNLLKEASNNDKINGIVLQLPLPDHLKERQQYIINQISPEKDVDGSTDANLARLAIRSDHPYFQPCTPGAVLHILNENNIALKGKKCLIINKSRVVGIPLMHMLLEKDATITVAHSHSENMKSLVEMSDIILTAAGKYGVIEPEWIKPDSVVIDIATTFIQHKDKERLVGDIIFHEVQPKAKLITPVPGGVGPLTVMMVIQNILLAWGRRYKVKDLEF